MLLVPYEVAREHTLASQGAEKLCLELYLELESIFCHGKRNFRLPRNLVVKSSYDF